MTLTESRSSTLSSAKLLHSANLYNDADLLMSPVSSRSLADQSWIGRSFIQLWSVLGSTTLSRQCRPMRSCIFQWKTSASQNIGNEVHLKCMMDMNLDLHRHQISQMMTPLVTNLKPVFPQMQGTRQTTNVRQILPCLQTLLHWSVS